MRKLYVIVLLLVTLAGGVAWLMFNDAPLEQQRVEKPLNYEQYIQ